MDLTPLDPVSILLVDDQPRNLAALTAMLEQPGYRLVGAGSGAEALTLVLQESFAVILLDVLMPVMDGFEVASLIKARDRSRGIPIIFLTAAGEDLERVHQAYSLGAVDYLTKPVHPDVVKAKVAVFVELYRRTEEVKRQAEQLRELDRRERERQLDELKSASDRRYRDLAEAIPQMVWRAGPDGRIEYFTRRWLEYTGIPGDAQEGWAWLQAIHPDDRERFRSRWLASVSSGTRFQRECRVQRRADGAFRWHLCQALPETDPSGHILGWMGTYTDIDAQKRADDERAELLRLAETARAEAEEVQRCLAVLVQVSRLLNESLDPAVALTGVARHLAETICSGCVIEIVDEDGRSVPVAVVHRNPEEEERLRLAIGDPGRLIRLRDQLGTAEALGAWGAASLRAPIAARGQVVGTLTLLAPEPGRSYGVDEIALTGDIGRRIAIFIENTRLYVKAQRAIDARDEFLSIASHELRTPVTALSLQIQSLGRSMRGEAREPLSAEGACRKIELAEVQVARLTALLSALFDVSRIASGQLVLDVGDADLARIVRDVGARLESAFAAEGSALTVRAEEPVSGRWDAMRLEQVVAKLLGNALKYGEGRPVEATVRTEAGVAVLLVKDHGIGIAPENQARVFGRFERAAASISYGGLGLGLYISRQIVVAHGGTIGLESTPGTGTEVRVTLPIARA